MHRRVSTERQLSEAQQSLAALWQPSAPHLEQCTKTRIRWHRHQRPCGVRHGKQRILREALQRDRQPPLNRASFSPVQGLDNNEPPCLAGGGGGIFFFWQLGVIKYLREHFHMEHMQFVGASAGALVVTIAACGIDPDKAVEVAYRISLETRVWDRRLGLLGIWGGLIRQWLEELLPSDAHEICRGRLALVGTAVGLRKQVLMEGYGTREDLIQANMCSIHIPFFLDLRPFQYYKERAYVDGSLTDFLLWENGKLLTREGRSFVLDYSRDTELSFRRLDFVRLRSYDSVLELLAQGERYGARIDAAGEFGPVFERIRADPHM